VDSTPRGGCGCRVQAHMSVESGERKPGLGTFLALTRHVMTASPRRLCALTTTWVLLVNSHTHPVRRARDPG
jgi:hypothetical protein